jgi:hypothetical protein
MSKREGGTEDTIFNPPTRESARPCGCDYGQSPAYVCQWHSQLAEQERVRLQTILKRPVASDTFVDVARSITPTRPQGLPSDPIERKKYPITTGVLDYFPDAIAAVARVSHQGNEQHNPGQPLHWAREKSTDQADTLVRHLLQRGTLDTDGMRHSAKVAWRALALLQLEIEAEGK